MYVERDSMIQVEKNLVSVGIPTYNRPEGLRRTLKCIAGQTHQNLEIIVSDNCSPSRETENIVKEFMDKDSRIQYFRQEKNKGPTLNFQFVLEMATGEYFMWAADDDIVETFFIERCLNEMGDEYVAATMEAQYFSDNMEFEFFAEGVPFYDFYSVDKSKRLEYMLKYNYGNLYYSLFKRVALYKDHTSIFNCIDVKSLNEIFLFLFVIQKGNWLVIPQIGFHKKTDCKTYEQAKWEKCGGVLPNSNGFQFYLTLPSKLKYHISALKDIKSIISVLDVDNKHKLMQLAEKLMSQHYWFLVKRYRPPLF